MKTHFRAIIKPYTDISLGNCSYLDTCRNSECKYIHFEIERNLDKKEESKIDD